MPEVTGIDHIYIAVSDLKQSEHFYDIVLVNTFGFKKSKFQLSDVPHVQYFNRHFGYVLRPAHLAPKHDRFAPGLHHFCLRVDSINEVNEVSEMLRAAGVEASESKCFPDYAPDYWATFFNDPDGVQLEITNYRQERRDRHEHWDQLD